MNDYYFSTTFKSHQAELIEQAQRDALAAQLENRISLRERFRAWREHRTPRPSGQLRRAHA